MNLTRLIYATSVALYFIKMKIAYLTQLLFFTNLKTETSRKTVVCRWHIFKMLNKNNETLSYSLDNYDREDTEIHYTPMC